VWPASAVAARSGLATPPARPEPWAGQGVKFRRPVAPRLEVLLYAMAIAVMAGCNFLVDLGEPRGPIWDESYYLTTTQRYLEGTAQFASHPPLGLMLIAAGEAVSGANAGLDTHILARDKKISGEAIPAGFDFAGVRLASGVFGVLGALACFAMMMALVENPLLAAAFTNLYLFDNALIAQFRAAHLDAFQVAFALCALACFVRAFKRGPRAAPGLDLGLAVSCALATLVRANGVILLLLGVILVGRRFLARQGRWPGRAVLRALGEGAAMSLAFLLTVTAVFAAHLLVSRSPPLYGSPAASQDARFISTLYDDYLNRRRPLSAQVLLSAAGDYRTAMAADFEGVARTDANGSEVLAWPLGGSTINYRWDAATDRISYVQLVPNRVGWGIGLGALCGAALLVCARAPRQRDGHERMVLIAALLAVYAGFMAMNLWLSAARVLYVYHYFIGLILSLALAPLVFQEACARWPRLGARRGWILTVGTALLLAAFVFYAPLTFHRPLTHAACEIRNWPAKVVTCR
jgi:dolichyl-phosphate-mannose--protein O-mannosyl transferase